MDFKAIFSQLQNLITKLNRKQQIVILVTVIIIVAFLSYLLVSSLGSKTNETNDGYGILFSAESPNDAGSAVTYLKQQNIPYKMVNENTIAVPQNQVFALRNELASQGIIKGRVDYSIFDDNSFGQTSEELKIKQLRARRGQLEKTLMALAPIKDARVEIAEPKDDVFVSKQEVSRASVALTLHENMGLTPKQIFGIKNLVANSFNGLTPDNVFIVDQNGSPLGTQSQEDIENEQAFKNQQYKNRAEQDMADKIRHSLGKLVGGSDRMTVSVTMEYDFGKQESVETIHSKESAVASETGEEILREGRAEKDPGGVPGVINNISETPDLDSKNKEKYQKSAFVKNYLPDKKETTTKLQTPQLKRMSVAVIVDGNYAEELDEKTGLITMKYSPRSPEELEGIRKIVEAASGYQPDRQDVVNIMAGQLNAIGAGVPPLSNFEKVAKAVEKYLGPFMPLLRYVLVVIVLFFFYKKVIAPFAERMLEVHDDEETDQQPLFDFDDDDDTLNRANEMRKKVEEQLGIGSGFNEDAVKYDVLLEKIKEAIKTKPDEVAGLFQALIRDEIEMK
ncbi:flagellar M-ring protein FliF [Helicobacter didelphidarum]|uniref:Flagellar M-ring protein n=1 Tax=Helicobacter didelphidarum TaxID=2040648 RepID=A0A3D8IP34_9HELI|nr:flagellar basal-body MS-ring/collar protein FliF [Helicobacter didelphidarum]RDU66982.1 flagellar M-ring protein FliF [Helicobacter didelphidarum]